MQTYQIDKNNSQGWARNRFEKSDSLADLVDYLESAAFTVRFSILLSVKNLVELFDWREETFKAWIDGGRMLVFDLVVQWRVILLDPLDSPRTGFVDHGSRMVRELRRLADIVKKLTLFFVFR